MSSILIGLFTLILIIICILLVLVILMQRPNANAGMGSALGGGAAQDMFGGETGNVLTKATVKLSVLFFVISAGLYLGYLYSSTPETEAEKKSSLSIITEATPTETKATEKAADTAKKAEATVEKTADTAKKATDTASKK